MFKKTRLQLALLNALVVFLLLSGFGAVLYSFSDYRLHRSVDEVILSLRQNALSILSGDDQDFSDDHPPAPSTYVYWDSSGQVLLKLPEDSLSEPEVRDAGKALPQTGFSSINSGDASLRIWTGTVPGTSHGSRSSTTCMRSIRCSPT